VSGETAPLDEVIREHALKVLRVFGGNQSRAAAALGVSRSTLRRWLTRWKCDLAAMIGGPR